MGADTWPDADGAGHAAAMVAAANPKFYSPQVVYNCVGTNFPGAGGSGAHHQGVPKDGVVQDYPIAPHSVSIRLTYLSCHLGRVGLTIYDISPTAAIHGTRLHS